MIYCRAFFLDVLACKFEHGECILVKPTLMTLTHFLHLLISAYFFLYFRLYVNLESMDMKALNRKMNCSCQARIVGWYSPSQ